MNENYKNACELLEQNKLEEAYAIFTDILSQDEGCYMSLNKLGVIFARQNNPEKAAECFQKALMLCPDFAPAIVNLGNQAQEHGDGQSALDYYKTAIDKDPNYHMAYYNMSVAYKTMGNYDEYYKYLKQYKHYYKQHLNNTDKAEAARLRGKVLSLSGIAIAILVLLFILK